jgi:hypothetical protein
MQATFTTALAAVPHRSLPRASSLVNSTRFIAQALGVALLATVLASGSSPDVRRQQQAQTTTDAGGVHAGICEPAPDGDEGVPRVPMQRACEEHLRGFRRAYTVTIFASIAALITGAFLPGWPSTWTGRAGLESLHAA